MLINSQTDYLLAITRFEAIADSNPGTPAHHEMLTLATAINMYEQSLWTIYPEEAGELHKKSE